MEYINKGIYGVSFIKKTVDVKIGDYVWIVCHIGGGDHYEKIKGTVFSIDGIVITITTKKRKEIYEKVLMHDIVSIKVKRH